MKRFELSASAGISTVWPSGVTAVALRRKIGAKMPPTSWPIQPLRMTLGAVIITGTITRVRAVETNRPETSAADRWVNHEPAMPPSTISRRRKSNSRLIAIGMTPSAVTVAVSSTGRTRWLAVISIALIGSTPSSRL